MNIGKKQSIENLFKADKHIPFIYTGKQGNVVDYYGLFQLNLPEGVGTNMN